MHLEALFKTFEPKVEEIGTLENFKESMLKKVEEKLSRRLTSEDIVFASEEEKAAYNKEFDCPTCYNILEEPMKCRQCKVSFCQHCLRNFREGNIYDCPMCRYKEGMRNLKEPDEDEMMDLLMIKF